MSGFALCVAIRRVHVLDRIYSWPDRVIIKARAHRLDQPCATAFSYIVDSHVIGTVTTCIYITDLRLTPSDLVFPHIF